MSFFKDLKEDIAQSISELSESLDENLGLDEKNPAGQPDSLPGNESADLTKEQESAGWEELNVLDGADSSGDADMFGELEPMDVLSVVDSAESAEPTGSAAELEPTMPIEFAEPIESMEEPTMPIESTESAESMEQPVEEPEPAEPVELAEPAEEPEAIEHVEEEPIAMENEVNANTYADEEEVPEVTVITKGTTISGGIKSDTSLVVKGVIEGDVECDGKLTITGRVTGNTIAAEIYVNTPRLEGDINSKGIVKIDVGTVVIGSVSCTSVVIAGAVKGDIEVNGPVVIDSTAVVKGNISAKSIQINSGAVIDGHCSLQFADVDLDSFFE